MAAALLALLLLSFASVQSIVMRAALDPRRATCRRCAGTCNGVN